MSGECEKCGHHAVECQCRALPALPADLAGLVDRLRGAFDEHLTVIDRLRLYSHDPKTFDFDADDALAALDLTEEAASILEALAGRQVAVKPLTWEPVENEDGVEWLEATPYPGAYEIYHQASDVVERGVQVVLRASAAGSGDILGFWPTLPEAQAAAQQDYEQRIRSALFMEGI